MTANRFPMWEIRHLDGRAIARASISLQSGGLGQWVKVACALEFGCQTQDVKTVEDDDGLDWIEVTRVDSWDVVARDFTLKTERVGYCQMAGQPIRDCPPLTFAFPFLEAAE
jgi:hypothetical protein